MESEGCRLPVVSCQAGYERRGIGEKLAEVMMLRLTIQILGGCLINLVINLTHFVNDFIVSSVVKDCFTTLKNFDKITK